MSERNDVDVTRLGVEDVLMLAAIVALPWFYGGVGIAAYRGAAAVIALAAGVALARRGLRGLGLGRRALWLLPAFLLGVFAFVQAVPLPRAWVAALSPTAAAIEADAYGPGDVDGQAWLRRIEADARARVPEAGSATPDATGALALGEDAPAPPRRFTLSLQPDTTGERAFWYAALLLAFLFVHRRTADASRAAVYLATVFSLIGVMAILGILNHLGAPDTMLWFRAIPDGTHPFGPYVNRDHFAGVMELGVPWLLGYGLMAISNRRGRTRLQTSQVLALAGGGSALVAALLAASKTAAVTIAVSSTIVLAVAARGAARRVRWGILGGAAAGVLLLAAIALSGPLRGRVADFLAIQDKGVSVGDRAIAWRAGLTMGNDYLWTGSGFGAFPVVFNGYLPRGDAGAWLQLHNDYLELYAAGGLIGVALVSWLAVAFAVRVAFVLRSEFASGRGLPALGLALGLGALAAHELVDFNLQIPANALLFVVLAALSVSGLNRRVEEP